MELTQLDPDDPSQAFPPLQKALQDPNGLLAYGGCLSVQRLKNAYQQGVFPWYNPGEPILWWSPNPRLVLFPEKLKISRSLHKVLRKQLFEIHYDRAFEQVVDACSLPREINGGTWISAEMKQAYTNLYKQGIAHSVEAWQNQQLVGGLYGVAIGQVFFGESMFHLKTDASKVAFISLVQQLSGWGYQLIDCQVTSDHLLSLGAEEISRNHFETLLNQLSHLNPHLQAWSK